MTELEIRWREQRKEIQERGGKDKSDKKDEEMKCKQYIQKLRW